MKKIALACGMPEESGPTFKLTVDEYVPREKLVVGGGVCTFDGAEVRGTADVERWKDPAGEAFIVYGKLARAAG